MKKYKWLHWIFTVLYIYLSYRFIHRAITEQGMLDFIFGLCCIGLVVREIYPCFGDKKKG